MSALLTAPAADLISDDAVPFLAFLLSQIYNQPTNKAGILLKTSARVNTVFKVSSQTRATLSPGDAREA
jgi:hypothetical protein